MTIITTTRSAICLAGATATLLLSAPFAAAGDQEFTGGSDRDSAIIPDGGNRDTESSVQRVFVDDDAIEVVQVALGMLAGTALVGAAAATRGLAHRHHVQSA